MLPSVSIHQWFSFTPRLSLSLSLPLEASSFSAPNPPPPLCSLASVITCDEADGHISYFEDKADCTRYFMCEGERKHHMPCPVNLVFNAAQSVCDWPENVPGCETAISNPAAR